jgi:hypothetical protein
MESMSTPWTPWALHEQQSMSSPWAVHGNRWGTVKYGQYPSHWVQVCNNRPLKKARACIGGEPNFAHLTTATGTVVFTKTIQHNYTLNNVRSYASHPHSAWILLSHLFHDLRFAMHPTFWFCHLNLWHRRLEICPPMLKLRRCSGFAYCPTISYVPTSGAYQHCPPEPTAWQGQAGFL